MAVQEYSITREHAQTLIICCEEQIADLKAAVRDTLVLQGKNGRRITQNSAYLTRCQLRRQMAAARAVSDLLMAFLQASRVSDAIKMSPLGMKFIDVIYTGGKNKDKGGGGGETANGCED